MFRLAASSIFFALCVSALVFEHYQGHDAAGGAKIAGHVDLTGEGR
jgi:hypothetical protein